MTKWDIIFLVGVTFTPNMLKVNTLTNNQATWFRKWFAQVVIYFSGLSGGGTGGVGGG